MKRFTELLAKLLELIVTVSVAGSVLVVIWGVFSRFVVSVPSRWTEELAINLLSWVALLGAALAFRKRQHLGVDLIFNRLDPDAQRLNAILIQLLVILFAAVVMIWGGVNLVMGTLSTGQITAALGIRVGLTYLAIPLSGLAIVLFAIEEIVELIRLEKSPAAPSDSEIQRQP